jgi:hypothetical protein
MKKQQDLKNQNKSSSQNSVEYIEEAVWAVSPYVKIEAP